MGKYRICVIPGDGIGPEVTNATLLVLKKIQELSPSFEAEVEVAYAGDCCLKEYGEPLPRETLKKILSSDATLKGPVGESAADVIVRLRRELDLYANVRPFKTYPGVNSVAGFADFVIVRENTEGLYKGFEFTLKGELAVTLRVITRKCCKRIARFAFELARKRRKKVTAVHKANVMRATCGLFARVCRETAREYGDVTYEEMYVDACAMELIRNPRRFDVIVTTNMFGDILSDEAAQVVGSLGIAASGNIGDKYAIFEPVHGAAPDIAGKGIANPLAMILSLKMMLEWFDERRLANLLEKAVILTLKEDRVLTPDLGGNAKTVEVARAVCRRLGLLAKRQN